MVLHFIEGISHKISKILIKKGVLCAFKLISTIKKYLLPLEDSRDTFLESRVYKVSCSCGMPYIGEIGRSFTTRIKEHSVNIKHERVVKSSLSKHSSLTKHHIFLENSQILAKENNYYKRKMKDVIEIFNHPTNLNRDEGWALSLAWHPPLSSIKRPHHPRA